MGVRSVGGGAVVAVAVVGAKAIVVLGARPGTAAGLARSVSNHASAEARDVNVMVSSSRCCQAGVRSAECLRAHGLPNVQDPNAQTAYTPGHGFGFTMGEIPPGGKASPVFQHAAGACRSLLDAEIRASTLSSLDSDG